VIAALGAMDRSPAEFEKDFPAVARRVQDNVGKFLLAGINITPAVYIDGLKMKAGTISETGIEELIKKRLALKEK
jgi:protein-disulfide isomerase